MLSKAGYQLTGIHPRNFIITPNGKYLLVACRDSNVIQVYERDADTGLLTDVQQDIKVDKPVCIRFVPISYLLTLGNPAIRSMRLHNDFTPVLGTLDTFFPQCPLF